MNDPLVRNETAAQLNQKGKEEGSRDLGKICLLWLMEMDMAARLVFGE